MRSVTIPLLASCATLVAAACGAGPARAQAARPSFDCARATEADEVAICSDPALARLDVLHADAYVVARRADPRGADREARESLAERHACGMDRVCILDRLSSGLPSAPGWVAGYRARLVREAAGEDLRPRTLGRVGRPQSFPTTAHGIQATLTRVDGLDTARASASGVVTPSDEMEYCVREWERDARHGPRPTRSSCAREVRDLDTRFETSADCPAKRVTLPDGTWTLVRFEGELAIWRDPKGEEEQPWNGTAMADSHLELLCPNTTARLRARAAIAPPSPAPVVPAAAVAMPAPAQVAPARPEVAMVPYMRAGVVDCAAPGITVGFALSGDGRARLTRFDGDHAGFARAGAVRQWSASVTTGADRLLVLDDGAGARVMASIPDGKGTAFAGPDGVTDVLCRILVRPE